MAHASVSKTDDSHRSAGSNPASDTISKSKRRALIAFEKGYRIRDDGSIVTPTGITASLFSSKRDKYPCFSARTPFGHRVPVHLLAALQWFGTDNFLSSHLEVRHLNGNRTDSSRENIALGTHSENMFDVPKEVREWRSELGAQKVRSLTPEKIRALKEDRARGLSYRELTEKHGVKSSTLSYLFNGKTYRQAAVSQSAEERASEAR